MDRKAKLAMALFAALLLAGMIGYHFIEGWPYLDALYMTIITVSTVGFREVTIEGEISTAYKIFTVGLGDSKEGMRIPVRDESGRLHYLKDSDQREVWSKLNGQTRFASLSEQRMSA